MSIFDLTKDEIDAELENVVERDREPNSIATRTVENMEVKSSSHKKKSPSSKVQTDHIPSLPGCYFWRDANGRILYIGKANKLRSRVRSYLSPNARHGTRIQVMVSKADSVDVIVTPSERDALVLESNLIKHHQPPFNVLLKDDEHYPYICASVGDPLPRLFVAPRVDETMIESQRHHYFGPYTSFKEINSILDGIENEYNLRQQSFLARHGDNSKEEYQKLFERVLSEVFGNGSKLRHYLNDIRAQYEEAGLLFDSKYNENRDVVVVEEMEESSVIVYVVQLRQGTVKGRFSYQCKVPIMPSNDDDKAEIIQTVLMRYHYPSGRSTTWFPDDLLLAQKPHDSNSLVELIRKLRKNFGGRRKKTTITFESDRRDDTKALEFAIENSMLEGFKKSNGDRNIGLVDGKASKELQELLRLEILPRRIECYDISHTAGSSPVASRVVFIDGNPAKQFYRRFNIKSIDGIDDFAAIEEALFRRFRRADSAEEEDSWKSPDLVRASRPFTLY
jgi:excinuclease ABC subunit C